MDNHADPWQAGKAPWFEEARKISQHWADGLDLTIGGVDLAQTIAYPMLEAINRYFLDSANKATKEPAA